MATTQASQPAGPDPDGGFTPHSRRRTALVVAAVSLVAAAVVVVPFVARGLGHPAAAPAEIPVPSSSPSPVHSVGSHADLPALFPAAPRHRGRVVVTDNGDRWSLRRLDPGAAPGSASYVLVVRSRGTVRSVRVPAGPAPVLQGTPVSIGELTDGVLVSQKGGGSDTWRVFVAWGGRISTLKARGPVALGGGFTHGTAYLSWLGADGRPYTRLGTSRPGHFRVWAWLPSAATAWTPPVLVAHSLGTVCLDDVRQTYGTCRG